MYNVEEIDKFLEMYTLLRLNQEEIEIMNRIVTSNDIESVVIIIKKKLPIKKVQDQMASIGEFTKHLENH